MLTIDDTTHETTHDGTERYTLAHPAGPIVLEIIQDPVCENPLVNNDYAPALAMIDRGGRSDYIGTVDNVPGDLAIDCPNCEGHGSTNGEDDCPKCAARGTAL